MTHHPYPNLFSPLRIGGVELRNRIFSSGHDTVMAENGLVTDRLLAYHEARARGGVGLIVMQVVGVHESARYTSHVLMGTDDACIDGFRRMAETVHSYGTRVFAQLFHPGREIMESQDGSMPVALAPSAIPNERFHVLPRAMTLEVIEEVVAGYAATARRLYEAGLDGVEVVASHGYLPAQFLNPHTNVRDDAYGGDDRRRQRFLREVIAAIRAATGSEFAVGMRISADERSVDGLAVDDVTAVCAALVADPGLDYISACAGSSATIAGSDHIAPSMAEDAGYVAPLAARLKEHVDVPVLVAGRINQPQDAELIVADGSADACAMTRALICDPELPSKASAGRSERIRACIGCNQACIGHFHAGYPISCIQHPETGRERTYGIRGRTRRPRHVLVAGGGPAGLKAAAVAAERGHRVTLLDAGRRPGGQVLLAERLPGRAEFGGAATNLVAEAERAGVELVSRTRVDAELVHARQPDAVVVATGARPRVPDLELTDELPVFTAWDVLSGAAVPRGRTVIVEWRPDWIGMGLARALAEAGHEVTLAVNGYQAGETVQQYVRDAMLGEVYRAGVSIVPLVRPYGADDDTVYLQHVLTGEPVLVENVTSMVLSQGHVSDDDLGRDLADYPGEVISIGDCLAPRTVEEAVLEGLRAGTDL